MSNVTLESDAVLLPSLVIVERQLDIKNYSAALRHEVIKS